MALRFPSFKGMDTYTAFTSVISYNWVTIYQNFGPKDASAISVIGTLAFAGIIALGWAKVYNYLHKNGSERGMGFTGALNKALGTKFSSVISFIICVFSLSLMISVTYKDLFIVLSQLSFWNMYYQMIMTTIPLLVVLLPSNKVKFINNVIFAAFKYVGIVCVLMCSIHLYLVDENAYNESFYIANTGKGYSFSYTFIFSFVFAQFYNGFEVNWYTNKKEVKIFGSMFYAILICFVLLITANSIIMVALKPGGKITDILYNSAYRITNNEIFSNTFSISIIGCMMIGGLGGLLFYLRSNIDSFKALFNDKVESKVVTREDNQFEEVELNNVKEETVVVVEQDASEVTLIKGENVYNSLVSDNKQEKLSIIKRIIRFFDLVKLILLIDSILINIFVWIPVFTIPSLSFISSYLRNGISFILIYTVFVFIHDNYVEPKVFENIKKSVKSKTIKFIRTVIGMTMSEFKISFIVIFNTFIMILYLYYSMMHKVDIDTGVTNSTNIVSGLVNETIH